jgi:3-hydroxyisobutyryl-CoA hydrolase
VKALLAKFSEEPESESPLKKLLPSIVSCFGGGKSVQNSLECLRKEECSSDVSGKL